MFFKNFLLAILVIGLYFFSHGNCEEISSKTEELKKYNLSVCSIFKNEEKYLKEWIEYHLMIGVDHFYLYNVESKDNYVQVLKPYITKDIVTLVEWPNLSKKPNEDDSILMLSTLIPAYENAAKYLAYDNTNWLVFVNIDEFLVPPGQSKITDILNKYNDYPAVILPSEYYDASEFYFAKRKKLIIENTELSLPPVIALEKTIEKTIFKPKRTQGFTWPPYKFEFNDNQFAYTLKSEELRINHYTNKKIGYFNPTKNKDRLSIDTRQLAQGEKKMLLERYLITDEEQSIMRFLPEMRKKMGISNFDD